MVGDYSNIMNTTFLFKFLLLASFYRITSLQAIKNKFFLLTASLRFHAFVYPCFIEIKIKLKSRVHYIDKTAYHRV